MSRTRLDLQAKFEEICDNVYFQKPRDNKMIYPCILYNLSRIRLMHANNKVYNHKRRYTVTYITKNPDDPIIDSMLYLFEQIHWDRQYESNNLYHNVYELYF